MQIGYYINGGEAFPIPQTTGDFDVLSDVADSFDSAIEYHDLGLLREGVLVEVYDVGADKVGARFDEVSAKYGILQGTYDDTGGAIPYITVREADRAELEALAARPLDRAARRREQRAKKSRGEADAHL